MRPYACYPKTRAGYRPHVTGWANPYQPQHTVGNNTTNPVAARPAANILRTDGAYTIEMAVPGFTRDQIKIEIQDDQLIISGQSAKEGADLKMVRKEFDYSTFKRVFRLHKNANTNALTATFEQGILAIVIPDAQPETMTIHIQ